MAAVTSTPKLFHKFLQRKPFSVETGQIILNVYATLRKQYPDETIRKIILRVTELTGVSKSTVWKLKKNARDAGGKPTPPRRTLFKRRYRRARVDMYENFSLEAIRRLVHRYFRRNEPPTVLKVLTEVNGDPELPDFKKTTFLRLLHDIGFKFNKRARDSALIDRDDIQVARRQFLRKIRDFRTDNRSIYYLDETWINAGHHVEISWQDTTIKSSKQAQKMNLTSGLKIPSGKGKRLIITHAGNENGFVQGAQEIFIGKKTGDYHEEMDGPHFERWFTSKLLPNISDNSVIVMDNASYHSVKLERIPVTSTKKADIQEWLTSKGISWLPDMIKKELLQLVNYERHKYDRYRIDTIAADAGHTVLRLPPYHCELNPIELVWGHVKNRVAKRNSNFNLSDVQLLAEEALSLETPAMWANSVRHVIEKEEPRFWKLDGMLDVDVPLEPFILSVNNGSSSDSNFSQESSEDE